MCMKVWLSMDENKANIYILYIYLEWCICTYPINIIWFKNVGKICAMTNLPNPPLVDVKQYSRWQFAREGNSCMQQSPITPFAPNEFRGALFGSQHYVWRCWCFSIYPHKYIDSWWYLIICVCTGFFCIRPGFLDNSFRKQAWTFQWSHESKGKHAKQSHLQGDTTATMIRFQFMNIPWISCIAL